MRLTRVYISYPISVGKEVVLDAAASGHLLRVLRLKVGDMLRIFNGEGEEYTAQIMRVSKQSAVILILEVVIHLSESPLFIHLGQGISRGEKMDYSLQKSVELGVKKITPLLTERGGVKLSSDRLKKKMEHWQKVIISACEQCGRNYLPALMPVQTLQEFLVSCVEEMRFVLVPSAECRLRTMTFNEEKIALLVGAEGGLSEQEILAAKQHAFSSLQLGPRILRTETAGPVAIGVLQCLWGDLG